MTSKGTHLHDPQLSIRSIFITTNKKNLYLKTILHTKTLVLKRRPLINSCSSVFDSNKIEKYQIKDVEERRVE